MNMIQSAKDQVLALTTAAYQKAAAAGLLPEYAPAMPEELLPLFAWEKLPRGDRVFSLDGT